MLILGILGREVVEDLKVAYRGNLFVWSVIIQELRLKATDKHALKAKAKTMNQNGTAPHNERQNRQDNDDIDSSLDALRENIETSCRERVQREYDGIRKY
jgi:hypothetical protein